MSEKDGQPVGIELSDYHDNMIILYFLLKYGKDDSNASDNSFKFDHSYQKEFDKQLEKER